MKTNFIRTLAITVALLGGVAAAPAFAQENSVLRYAIWSNPNGTFHPSLYFTDYDRAIIFNVYGRLVTLDEKQGYVPSLAKSFEYSADGKSLTLKLRDDVKWHDGEPFTAADVVFTYTAIASGDYPLDTPAFAAQLEGFEAYNSGAAETISGITSPDDQTVTFTFKAPYAAALAHFADRPVLAKHVWESTPVAQWAEATDLLRNPIGTGPYKFSEFVSDQYVSLVRNDDYFGGAPKIETLIFKVTNAQTAQTELLNGELDIAELSSWNQGDLRTYEDNGAKIIEQTGVGGQYLTLDNTDTRLADPRVRQALIHAINRQGIVDSVLYGHGIVFNSNAHPDSPYYPTDLDTYPYDPAKAEELLAAAGWTDSDGDGLLDKDGEKFAFTINFPVGNKTRELSAPIIQQNLQAIGIEAELVSADFNSTLSILQNAETPFDGVLMGGTFRPGQYGSDLWWERLENDPKYVALAAAVNSTVVDDELRSAVGAWLGEVNKEAVRVWLYIPNKGYALSPRVTNYTSIPYETFAGIENWTVAE